MLFRIWFEYFLFYEEMVIEVDILRNEADLMKEPELEVHEFKKQKYLVIFSTQ
jgi:hypothetical protein